MTADPPGPDDPEKDKELFTLFRGLRERIFDGSSELVTRVMRGVEEQLQGKSDESLAASVLVQLTNLVTSWLDLDDTGGSPDDEDEARRSTEGDDE